MMTKKIKQRRHVTLIEMLLVMVILSLIASVIGISIAKAIREQRFRSEVHIVVDQLRLAQDLMLIADVDVHLKFEELEGSIKFWLETSKKLPGNWSREIERSHKLLSTIRSIEFDDGLGRPYKMGELDIKFLSGGGVMSFGVIRLGTSGSIQHLGALEKFILLRGYPAPITATNDPNFPANDTNDDALSTYIFREINGKE